MQVMNVKVFEHDRPHCFPTFFLLLLFLRVVPSHSKPQTPQTISSNNADDWEWYSFPPLYCDASDRVFYFKHDFLRNANHIALKQRFVFTKRSGLLNCCGFRAGKRNSGNMQAEHLLAYLEHEGRIVLKDCIMNIPTSFTSLYRNHKNPFRHLHLARRVLH